MIAAKSQESVGIKVGSACSPVHKHNKACTIHIYRSDGKVWQSRPRTNTHTDKQWIDFFDQEDKKPKPRGKVTIDGELVHGLNERSEVSCAHLRDLLGYGS
jgi:hypothetical protein